MLYGIAAATAALFLAAVLTALLRLPARRLGMLDRRRQRPVPLAGGPAVALACCLVAGAGAWTGLAPLGPGIGRLLAAGAAVAALGLVADVRRIKARLLVGGTAVAAACVVPYRETGLAGGLLATGWIVFVAVSFKALDHADALAGTTRVVTAFAVGACAAADLMDGLAVLLSVLAAALTGFLMHNWHPARAALGASGSLFAGFVLAAAAVHARAGQGIAGSAGVLFALTALSTADVLLVVLSRRLAGRPLLRSGPDHLAHRLRRLGLTPQGVTVLLGLGGFAGVLVGVLAHLGWIAGSGGLWAVAGAVTLGVVVFALLRIPVYGPRRSVSTQVRGQLRVRNG
ncbi:MraY family glycosyltransferase [Streptomyces sp. NPDC005840]|uniref:MraY family glycosyltransferase n=1 Tax=Streptomyces sp. NPDC005840 TaxID=3157072 RepID=UPI0033C749B1